MRYLVVCCDGTWNTPEQDSVTNVFRLYNALGEKGADGVEQLKYYQGGVGTGAGLLAWLAGGMAGAGLSSNVMEAYRWLATTYEPGDRIALFGFSRGAYTARSVAGLISACGVLDTQGKDDATIQGQIEHAYQERYRRGDEADASWREGLTFRFDPADAEEIPVWFVGVWDTVGSLGIPDNLALLNLWDSPHRHAFHDVKLNPHIRFARHAVAMDERRAAFAPALWDEEAKGANQDLQQVYFPGSHMDVGGGHRETGLSDGALRWMIEESQEAGLTFDEEMLQQIRPDDGDMLHDDERSAVRALGPLYDPLVGPLLQPFFETRPRTVPRIDPQSGDDRVHASAYARQERRILTCPAYRPARVLSAQGFPAEVSVLAREPWNDTGLYLEPGQYVFAAEGEWKDGHIRAGADGTTGLARFNPLVERLRLIGTALGPPQKLIRWMSGNKAANPIGSRREDDLPWMSLVCVVANEHGPTPHQRVEVGEGSNDPVMVTRGGYLYAFANDAWGFYLNNSGSVRLTVTRTA